MLVDRRRKKNFSWLTRVKSLSGDLPLQIINYELRYIFAGGMISVMVIVAGNEIGEPRLSSGRDCLGFTSR